MDMVTGMAHPKPTPRKRIKAKAKRHENKTQAAARAHCVTRDGRCVVSRIPFVSRQQLFAQFGLCEGPATLMHLAGHRKGQTKKQAPEHRHNPAMLAMGCVGHHEAEEHKGLRFVPLTERGMDGPVAWTVVPAKTLRGRP